jgi:C-terminal processing protease CtpA/Prc
LISVSNETSLRRWSHYLLFNKIDSINVDVVKKNGEKINKNIKLYNQYENKEPDGISFYINKKVSIIDNETMYINLENITKKEISEFFKTNKNINNLIIDLRNYPKFINEQDICDYILPEKTTFIKILSPLNKKPAISSFFVSNIATKIFKPFEVGYHNENYFKGKIILMVDSFTQSNAEFIAMAIQSSKNCITIGEQTGGSVMNITNVELLDGSKMSFTGSNAYYPNGLKVFGNGIKLDYKLNPTTKDLNPEYYIKKALEILKN